MIVSAVLETWPLIAAFIGSVVGIIAALLVARGVRGPAAGRIDRHD
jgi:hypothetical protein